MKTVLERYQGLLEEFKVKRAVAEEKRNKKVERVNNLEARLERAKVAAKKADDEMYAIHHPSLYEHIIEPLAKKLADHFGLEYELYGPFGMECETSIYLSKDLNVSICDQKTISLTLRPDWEKNWLTYNTGKKINRYPKGSLGDMNGYNDVYAPLPMEFDEILKLVTNDFEKVEKDKEAENV